MTSDQNDKAQRAAAPWSKSFPAGSVDGSFWILDVLGDLQAYAEHHGMTEVAKTLSFARQDVNFILSANEFPDPEDKKQ